MTQEYSLKTLHRYKQYILQWKRGHAPKKRFHPINFSPPSKNKWPFWYSQEASHFRGYYAEWRARHVLRKFIKKKRRSSSAYPYRTICRAGNRQDKYHQTDLTVYCSNHSKISIQVKSSYKLRSEFRRQNRIHNRPQIPCIVVNESLGDTQIIKMFLNEISDYLGGTS